MTNSGYWIERKSARGYVYRVWRSEPMPQIEQQYLDCAIYLYASVDSAKAGENFGGSGCLVSIVSSDPVWDKSSWNGMRFTRAKIYYPPHIYAVTNGHVARRGSPVIRLNTIDGETDVLDLHHGDWIPHPAGDDLAVAPIDLPPGIHAYVPIKSEMLLKEQDISRVGAGDDTFMVGRFINHAGKQRNTPSLRFGNVAMLPFEKVKLGKEANFHEQEAFLVETRSISGFSGSPVFVYQSIEEMAQIPPDYESPYDQKSEWAITRYDPVGDLYLLGIDCGHIPKYEKVVNGAGTPHPQWKVDTNTGMSIVIPAWRLMDLLNKPELVMQRKEKDEKYKQEKEQEETVSLDVERPEEFSRASFQDALRRASRKVSESKDSDKERGG